MKLDPQQANRNILLKGGGVDCRRPVQKLNDNSTVMKSKILLLLVLLLALNQRTLAQSASDTVPHRILIATINDSLASEIDYEIGQVRHADAGGYNFISFADSATPLDTKYLSTTAFITGSSDSLYFMRFAWFDNNTKYSGSPSNLTSAQADSILNYIKTKYHNRFILPDSAYFNSNSHVKFIAKLCRAADGFPLAYLDTLDCILDSGALRYINYPRSFSWRKIRLSDYVSAGDTVYLTVSPLMLNIPSGTTFAYTCKHSTQTTRSLQHSPVPIHQLTPWVGAPSTCLAPKLNGRVPVTNSQVQVRPYYDRVAHRIVAVFESNIPQSVHYDLVDIRGRVVKSGDAQIHSGSTEVWIPDNGLVSQEYIIRLQSELFTGDAKISIIK